MRKWTNRLRTLAVFAVGFPLALLRGQPAVSSGELVSRVTNAYPVFSPDGKWIAYMSNADGDFDIYVRSLNEHVVKKLTNAPDQDGTPAWSPDGKKIAFRSMRDGRSQVYVMSSDGSDQRNLSNNTFNDEHPIWTRDGKKIFFCSDRTTPSGSKDKNYDIFVMDATGDIVTQITHTPEVETYPSLSPDGSMIACRRIMADGDWEVVVMNADGSNARNVSNHAGVDGWPAWSPDGTLIAYASEVGERVRLFVMKPDGSGRRQISTDDRHTDDRQPSWSPTGRTLLYARYQRFPNQAWYEAAQIMIMKVGEK